MMIVNMLVPLVTFLVHVHVSRPRPKRFTKSRCYLNHRSNRVTIEFQGGAFRGMRYGGYRMASSGKRRHPSDMIRIVMRADNKRYRRNFMLQLPHDEIQYKAITAHRNVRDQQFAMFFNHIGIGVTCLD